VPAAAGVHRTIKELPIFPDAGQQVSYDSWKEKICLQANDIRPAMPWGSKSDGLWFLLKCGNRTRTKTATS